MALKMLLVDDEPLARSRLRTLLADCQNPAAEAVAEAANAAQAMEHLRRQQFDGVLLDIHMPGADGLALAQVLRTLPDAPAVVFVTAYAEHAVTAFELEAVDYLTKPVRLERLEDMLLHFIRHTLTGIDHGQSNVFSLPVRGIGCTDVRSGDENGASFRHGIARSHRQIENH